MKAKPNYIYIYIYFTVSRNVLKGDNVSVKNALILQTVFAAMTHLVGGLCPNVLATPKA
jgi:hypothetical protein